MANPHRLLVSATKPERPPGAGARDYRRCLGPIEPAHWMLSEDFGHRICKHCARRIAEMRRHYSPVVLRPACEAGDT
ncbi:hypothetical protein [Frigoriglobus tundricola]|uniref:Uncharacterized protein n=1 Tax=Frigoriglobus tundricola TaxID=2774151 RepID=A0A6M5Z090_9BACT|nr:hypothetical protein [Frigoriglobus tundricola]QJW98612.1 hypothetical protein FTUN_6207 [Frigoriglobus tundricola]